MMTADFIAEREFVGESPERGRFAVRLRIGKPYPTDTHGWACPVSVEGMPWRFPNIYGVDSFQALMLALSFARQYLQNFVDKGGQLWSDTDEPMSIEDLFGKGI